MLVVGHFSPELSFPSLRQPNLSLFELPCQSLTSSREFPNFCIGLSDSNVESLNFSNSPFQFLFILENFSVALSTEIVEPSLQLFILPLGISQLSLYLGNLLFVNINLLGDFNLESLSKAILTLFGLSSYHLVLLL